MIRASMRLSRVTLVTAIAGGIIAAPSALASQFDYFLKLPPIEGESDDKHKGEIEILSWSWGATQSGSAHVGGGMGAGKANVQDIAVAPRPAKGNVEYEWKVEEGESAPPPPGEAEITLKGSAAKGGTEDINIGVGELGAKSASPTTVQHDLRTNVVARTAKSTPPTVTLKRGSAARDAASGPPTGKRQHKPVTLTMGSLSLAVPAGMCRAGARYPSAQFGTPQQVFTLEGVVVTGCSPAAAGEARPTETLSLNYEKIR